jgi:hypothetical protein
MVLLVLVVVESGWKWRKEVTRKFGCVREEEGI